ncbi:CCHC-type domain-containing protein [Trichonephila clavipes]|nr:CCHC-type domain-containing protein [Trichonephila clavipes]
MPSPAFRREYTVLHTKCIRTLPRGKSSDERRRKVSHLMKEEIVQDEVERVLAPVSTKPTENRPRPTYAAVTRKYRAPVQKFPPEPRKTDVWRTADNRPVCFTVDVLDMMGLLEASQAVIDCGQNELVLEDICRDSTAPDAWNLYATRDYTLKPHSLTRITVSGYQTRGDINSSRRQQNICSSRKILLHRPWYPHIVTEK